MLRIALAAALVLASAGAYAQFNKCGHGFCPNGIFGRGVNTAGSSIAPPVCTPGNSTGEFDFSVCSNLAITAAVF